MSSRLSILAAVAAAILLVASCGDEPSSSDPAKSGPDPKSAGTDVADDVPADATGFIDRTKRAGFTFKNHTGKEDQKDFIVEAKGGGALVLDYDQDGDMDIYVVDGNTYDMDDQGNVLSRATHPDARNRLMRNDGNWRFTDVTKEAGVGDVSYGFGGGVGDYDNDGWPDIFVCNWGPNVLYRNNGDNTFTDVTAKAGVAGHSGYYSTCASFFDADADGDLDLYVSNYNEMAAFIKEVKGKGRTGLWRGLYVYCGPFGIPAAYDRFYRNNGNGTFTDETEKALKDQEARYAFTSVAGDFDNDGDIDVYVANDVTRNSMWVNDGTGHFDDKGDFSGTAVDEGMQKQAGMGNDSTDYDQDGWVDIFVTNFSHDKNTLYRNVSYQSDTLMFEDATERVGLAQTDFFKVCWGAKFQDFNLDGFMDIFLVAGHVYKQIDQFTDYAGTTYKQLPSLWYSQGPPRWRFVFVTDEVGGPGLKIPKVGRAACLADFDDDGDMDVYEAGLNDTPLMLENRLPRVGGWFMIGLEGKKCNRDAIGTRVTVYAGWSQVADAIREVSGGRTDRFWELEFEERLTLRKKLDWEKLMAEGRPPLWQIQEMRRSASFIGTNDPRLHWGVGKHEKLERVEVKWLGGATQVFEDVATNHLYRLTEGGKLERKR
ncbi:MAG: CRTAC1 family protein [Planctomycetota bacterium]|jgi:hypothetical protein